MPPSLEPAAGGTSKATDHNRVTLRHITGRSIWATQMLLPIYCLPETAFGPRQLPPSTTTCFPNIPVILSFFLGPVDRPNIADLKNPNGHWHLPPVPLTLFVLETYLLTK